MNYFEAYVAASKKTFEEWASDPRMHDPFPVLDLTKGPVGEYRNHDTNKYWAGWKAAVILHSTEWKEEALKQRK